MIRSVTLSPLYFTKSPILNPSSLIYHLLNCSCPRSNIVCSSMSSLNGLSEKTDVLTFSALERRQNDLDKRVSAFEHKQTSSAVHPEPDSRLEIRLEVLEREKLNSELILFGVREHADEDLSSTISNIASSLKVEFSSSEVVSCRRIPEWGDIPRPLIVKLSLNDVHIRWIDGKRARSFLSESEVSFSGFNIKINEHLTASAQQLLGAARRAVENGKLLHAWVRNGAVVVKRHSSPQFTCATGTTSEQSLPDHLCRTFGPSFWSPLRIPVRPVLWLGLHFFLRLRVIHPLLLPLRIRVDAWSSRECFRCHF